MFQHSKEYGTSMTELLPIIFLTQNLCFPNHRHTCLSDTSLFKLEYLNSKLLLKIFYHLTLPLRVCACLCNLCHCCLLLSWAFVDIWFFSYLSKVTFLFSFVGLSFPLFKSLFSMFSLLKRVHSTFLLKIPSKAQLQWSPEQSWHSYFYLQLRSLSCSLFMSSSLTSVPEHTNIILYLTHRYMNLYIYSPNLLISLHT